MAPTSNAISMGEHVSEYDLASISICEHYIGNSLDAQFGSLSYNIGNGIMLEIFLFNLDRIQKGTKRVKRFGTKSQCYFNGTPWEQGANTFWKF